MRHKDESQNLQATWLSYCKGKVISLTILAANHIKDFLCIIGIIYSVRYLMFCQSGVYASVSSQRQVLYQEIISLDFYINKREHFPTYKEVLGHKKEMTLAQHLLSSNSYQKVLSTLLCLNKVCIPLLKSVYISKP